jgi:hypothetical protein
MDLENNPRMEEWFLVVGDWFRQTSKTWYYALVLLLIIAIPLYMLLKLLFGQFLMSTIVPPHINYTEVSKFPLSISEKKIFDLGNGTYSGYVRIKNSNPDWGVPDQGYSFDFKSATGSSLLVASGSTFVLPGTEKIVVLPRFSPPQGSPAPTTLDFTLRDGSFVRPPALPQLNLEIQRRSVDLQVNQTIVNAVIVNRTAFTLRRVDLPILLFDNSNQIMGVNYTNINDLHSSESRSFQTVWYNRITNVSRVEILPEINVYNRDIFATVEGTNPFDDLD